MERFNFRAGVMWLFFALIGFLIAGLTGAVVGAIVGIALSLLAEIFNSFVP